MKAIQEAIEKINQVRNKLPLNFDRDKEFLDQSLALLATAQAESEAQDKLAEQVLKNLNAENNIASERITELEAADEEKDKQLLRYIDTIIAFREQACNECRTIKKQTQMLSELRNIISKEWSNGANCSDTRELEAMANKLWRKSEKDEQIEKLRADYSQELVLTVARKDKQITKLLAEKDEVFEQGKEFSEENIKLMQQIADLQAQLACPTCKNEPRTQESENGVVARLLPDCPDCSGTGTLQGYYEEKIKGLEAEYERLSKLYDEKAWEHIETLTDEQVKEQIKAAGIDMRYVTEK